MIDGHIPETWAGEAPAGLPQAVLEELHAVARSAARSAAAVTLNRPAALQVGAKTTANDAVTEVDTAAEAAIRAVLQERRPDDAVLGEEKGMTSGSTGVMWVVDPLDGTVNYVYGRDEYAVSVAAVAGGPEPTSWVPLTGVVVQPVTGVTWEAWRGGGAWRAGERLRPTADPMPAQALVATGFGYSAQRRQQQGCTVARILGQVRDIRRCGAAALDLCAVADGRLDGYYEMGLGPWDYAAGWLIVAEAGRAITGWAADAPSGAGLAAGAPQVQAALRGWLRDDPDAVLR